MDTIIPEQRKRKIPNKPPVELPSRKERVQLGTRSADLDIFDEKLEEAKLEFIRDAEDVRAELNRN